MKNILVLFSMLFLLSAVEVNGQANQVLTAPYDSVLTTETVYTGLINIQSSPDVILISGLCTDVGGTPDGTLILQGSIDGTSYINLAPVTGFISYFPNNDTLTITSGAIQTVAIWKSAYNFYRWKVTGTASDSTLVTTKYIYKTSE